LKSLVTGANGFLGLYVVEQLLARGDQVRAVCRQSNSDLKRLGTETVHADLRDREAVIAACEGVEAVFHVAGVAGIWGPWKHFYESNTLSTQYIIEGCRKHGVAKLIYTSSPSVTFDGGDQAGIDESAPYPESWLCHYPHSKALAEQQVLAAHELGGLLTCSLRPHLIWGPRDRHLIPRLLNRARSGRLRRIGDGQNLIDTIYVENAALAHLQVADALRGDSPPGGKAYFLSQGEPVNCWQWIDELLVLAGLPPVRKSLSFRSAWRLGSTFETLYGLLRLKSEPPMTRFLAAQLAKSHYFDITRARQDFGYKPRVSMEEGMQRLARDWRE
jgi:nucleoside-diphosphate-sugar epimerase